MEIYQNKSSLYYRMLSTFIVFAFIFTTITPPAQAQAVSAVGLNLPAVGTMMNMTEPFAPAMLKGLTIHPDNPLQFDFFVESGDSGLVDEELNQESLKMIKYFMAALTIPEDEMWVNLSPYEQDRVVPKDFGETGMGRDMLVQDYMLKQLTASLMYPEDELGEKFWKRIYVKSQEQFGTTEIPVNTFNKVWIIPEQAFVYEQDGKVIVVDKHLKVMLEEDYLAMTENDVNVGEGLASSSKHVTTNIIREILIPELEKEVNTGKTFANLRQMYNALILAKWYKLNFSAKGGSASGGKESLLGKIYVDQNKIKGVDIEDKESKQKIYDQYVESFKKGVYNYIREDYDPTTQEIIPRKYFSGGVSNELVEAGSPIQVGQGWLTSFVAPIVLSMSLFQTPVFSAEEISGAVSEATQITVNLKDLSLEERLSYVDEIIRIMNIEGFVHPDEFSILNSAFMQGRLDGDAEILLEYLKLQESNFSLQKVVVERIRRTVTNAEKTLEEISQLKDLSGKLTPIAKYVRDESTNEIKAVKPFVDEKLQGGSKSSASPLTILKKRQAGILLHPTSLPSKGGIGDFGLEAYKFIDKLSEAGVRIWQTLPLTPTNDPYGSPYSSISANGINEFFISFEMLVDEGLLDANDIIDNPLSIKEYKEKKLWKAYQRFKQQEGLQKDFEIFVDKKSDWLDNFALFKSIKNSFGGKFWKEWDVLYRDADEQTLNDFQSDPRNQENINFIKFKQYKVFEHWMALKAYAKKKNVDMFGDMPIYVAEDSADAWGYKELFQKGFVAGVPPDYFSETGQRWGNPLYKWDAHAFEKYRWWKVRFREAFEMFDFSRIDHFRAFEAYWEIPEEEETAINGRWVKDVPSDFFDVIRKEFGNDLPIIAEDLGTIDEDVLTLRDKYGFPGMKILQFAFGGDSDNPYLPHNIEPNSVVYTGTHDNSTTEGWWADIEADDNIKVHVGKYLGVQKGKISETFVQTAMQSNAVLAIVPIQDILELGDEAKMNVPGTSEGNWKWRLNAGQMDNFNSEKFRNLLEAAGRVEKVSILEKIAKINESDRYQVVLEIGDEGQQQYRLTDKQNNSSYMVDMKGFNIKSFKINGDQEILHENGIPVGYPWQGRISDGKFNWDGKEQDLNGVAGVSFNDGDPSAIHGMVGKEFWNIEDIGMDENGIFIKASFDTKDYLAMEKHFGKSKLTLTYRLEEDDLILDHMIENKDTRDIPVSLGYHPWIKADKSKMTIQGDPVEKYNLQNMIPSEKEFIIGGSDFDFSEEKGINEIPLDDVFQGMSVDSKGFWTYTLKDLANERTIEVRAQADKFPVAVLWNGWGDSVSVEPQAHAPNAVNNDMFLLKAGEIHEGRFMIRVISSSSFIADHKNKLSQAFPGGIDFNLDLLDLQIKRDGNGIPLPVWDQPIDAMNIEGFLPVIINVQPVSLPFLLGFVDEDGLILVACPEDGEAFSDCLDQVMPGKDPEEDTVARI